MREVLGIVVWGLAVLWTEEQGNDLYTKTYVIPPTFLSGPQDPYEPGWQACDSFADYKPLTPGKPRKKSLRQSGSRFRKDAARFTTRPPPN